PLAGLRVLVVDDTEINCDVARGILEAEGAKVTTASGGQQALEFLQTDPVACDIVLMDIQMPDMDGYEATRRIRQLPGLAALPIVALSAGALKSQRDAALAAGLDDYLSKPFDVEQIVRVLSARAAALATAARGPVAPPQAAPSAVAPVRTDSATAAAPANPPGLDVAAGLRICRQPHIYARALGTFSTNYGDAAQRMSKLAEAGMDTEVAALAHKLRGVAANLGMQQIAASAGQLEQAARRGALEQEWPQLSAGFMADMNEALTSARAYVATAGSPAPAAPVAAN
ncbi:MAG: response regulator, partial [Rhodocyclaceae bacterium]|nr:response regulator [Rhodocyclaceae bacterium]